MRFNEALFSCVHLSIYLSICLSVCLSICTNIRKYMHKPCVPLIDHLFIFLYLIRLFWNQTFTCPSDRPSESARYWRYAPTRYICIENSCSNRLSCSGVNVVRIRFDFPLLLLLVVLFFNIVPI